MPPTGVVVENFSYVFQLAGGAKAVDREQMRAFKKVWAEFANQRTGYLERSKFVPFFAVCHLFTIHTYLIYIFFRNLLEYLKSVYIQSSIKLENSWQTPRPPRRATP
jgi:hypothetical protein